METAHSTAPNESRKRFHFRLRVAHLLYAITLIGAALATFGSTGLQPAGAMLVFWAYVFGRRPRWRGLAEAIVMLALLGLFWAFFISAVQPARGARHRMQCSNNIKQIALALHNYHSVYKTFPPAYATDEDGRPMHSWRVLILPFLGEQELYDQYDFDEPWDGPSNRLLARGMPSVFACPYRRGDRHIARTHTTYVAVVGPNTAWPGQRATKFADFLDGSSNTLLVVETGLTGVPWMSPKDWSLEDAKRTMCESTPDFAPCHISRSFFYERCYYGNRMAALADGSARHLPAAMMASDVSALLSRNGGEPIDPYELRSATTPTTMKRRLRIDNCLRLAGFLLIVLLPLPWVWIAPTSAWGSLESQ